MFVELLVAIVIPLGLDLYMPVPDKNPLTAEKIDLGRQLFFDTRLSRDGSTSCATCHQPERGFSDGRALAIGVAGRVGRRNSPALVNRGYGRRFFWDGRASSLEEQVLKPIEDPSEMDLSVADAAGRVGLGAGQIADALSSYVRSILSGDSRFDRYVNGDRAALNEEEQLGLRIFRGKGRCTICHVGPNFADEELHDTGVAWNARTDGYADIGAGRGDFKTPTLRDVARTAPYMHDGSLGTLDDVVEFYDAGGRANPNLDEQLHPLGLSRDEKRGLVSFLRTLSGRAGR